MSEEIRWETISSEEKYKTNWLKVTEDVVRNHHGKTLVYGIAEINKGACILPIDEHGQVYLAKQYRYGMRGSSIEGAGGSIDAGETPLQAAQRELKEELGVEASEWIPVGHVNPLTGIVTHTEYLFIVKGFAPPHTLPKNEEEDIELVVIPLQEAVDMVMRSEIVHGPTMVLILKAARHEGV